MAELNFDATQHQPSTGDFDPVPNGTYPVMVTASEFKGEGDKRGLNLQMTIHDGEYKGRIIYEYLNLVHPSEQTVSIANRTLSAICHVTGVMQLKDSSQLHDRPFAVKVKVTEPTTKRMDDGTTKQYSAGNKVVQYLKADGTSLSVVQGGSSPATPTAEKPGAPAWISGAKKAS